MFEANIANMGFFSSELLIVEMLLYTIQSAVFSMTQLTVTTTFCKILE